MHERSLRQLSMRTLIAIFFVGCGGVDSQTTVLPSYGASDANEVADAGHDVDTALDGATPPQVRYARDVQPIWDQHCVSCHNGSLDSRLRGAWLDLRPGMALGMWSGKEFTGCGGESTRTVSVVTPGDPEASVLWKRINTDSTGCSGEMPPESNGGLHAIDPVATETIHQWILQGAKSD